YPYKQGMRLLVTPQAIGLGGESDLASSYAIYELLHRLGCRWYMPSDMGEGLPNLKTIALQTCDDSTGPDTIYRWNWYADNGGARRDRLPWLSNRSTTRLTARYPDVLFGMLAYVPNSRPPVREKLHPNLIPEIAPITFSRDQPMNDDGEPNNKDLRYIVEGWAK